MVLTLLFLELFSLGLWDTPRRLLFFLPSLSSLPLSSHVCQDLVLGPLLSALSALTLSLISSYLTILNTSIQVMLKFASQPKLVPETLDVY